jgi:hypothetical protein
VEVAVLEKLQAAAVEVEAALLEAQHHRLEAAVVVAVVPLVVI